MIVSIILIVFAAFCNAVMDKTDHHFSTSIFNRIKSKKWRLWFNENEGWKNKYVDRDFNKGRVKWQIFGILFNKPVQLTDAWHFFKMLMIFALAMIPAYNLVENGTFIYEINRFNYVSNLLSFWILFGITWNLTFYRIFYNGLFNQTKP